MKVELTEQEIKVLCGFLEHGVKSGVPSITDAKNAFILYEKLISQLPKEDKKNGD